MILFFAGVAVGLLLTGVAVVALVLSAMAADWSERRKRDQHANAPGADGNAHMTPPAKETQR